MATIRRYGPALVAPQVSPRPDLGRGREQTFAAFQDILQGANEFIRPAVTEIKTAQGEQEAIAAVDERGPQWGLRELRGSTSQIALGDGGIQQDGLQVGPTRVRAAIAGAGQRHGVDAGVLTTIAGIESSFNPAAQNPNSSAGGLFQFINSTASQYGLADRFDVDQAADAGARLARDNISRLAPVLGRQPTVGEIYLAHQQGAQGAINLLTAPAPALASSIVGRDAVRLNGGDPDTTTARDFAKIWTDKAENFARTNGITVSLPDTPEYELETLNNSTFEPRLPFTVRDAAFNSAANRVINARASSAMEEGMRAAMQRADGDLTRLRSEMEKVRSQVMGQLPKEMPGLATDLQEQYDRGRIVAERQAVELSQRRVVQRQQVALDQLVTHTQSEAERLALTGATAGELASHMAQATDTLAQFGPREGFTIAGRVYPPDPSRAGTMTGDAIAAKMAEVGLGARRLMIEADFMRSAAPGQYVDEFRRQVYAGNSPLPAAESLSLLRSMEGQARSADSARRTAAEQERRRLAQEMDTTINAYVQMGEAGVPVAIPAEERAQILSNLTQHPDLQRQAQIAFQVADAQVQTHGMTGSELTAYTDQIRTDMQAAVDRGELDLGGAAIIESLSDRMKSVQAAISAESIGLPLVQQLAMTGATVEDVNYDGLRDQAGGREDLIRAVNAVEAFHRDVESMQHMSAAERESVLESARQGLTMLAAQGEDFGQDALTTQAIVDQLSQWSDHRSNLAETDAMKFAQTVGVAMPSLQGAETMTDLGAIIGARVELIAPHSAAEGVNEPVPLTQAELDGIADLFQNSTRADRTEFLGSVAALGNDQAMAIFRRVGMAEPTLFAAGAVYTMGNQQAASIILRGSSATTMARSDDRGNTVSEPVARATAMGGLMAQGIISDAAIAQYDDVATAYATGMALSRGESFLTQSDLEEGYKIALGKQADGTGGPMEIRRFGATIAPAGFSERDVRDVVEDALSGDVDIKTGSGEALTARQARGQIEALVPGDAAPLAIRQMLEERDIMLDENTLLPVDEFGGFFLSDTTGIFVVPLKGGR